MGKWGHPYTGSVDPDCRGNLHNGKDDTLPLTTADSIQRKVNEMDNIQDQSETETTGKTGLSRKLLKKALPCVYIGLFCCSCFAMFCTVCFHIYYKIFNKN